MKSTLISNGPRPDRRSRMCLLRRTLFAEGLHVPVWQSADHLGLVEAMMTKLR